MHEAISLSKPGYPATTGKQAQEKYSGRHVVQLRAEPSEACPQETDPSIDFEREVSYFVDNAAQMLRTLWTVYCIPLASCFDDERWTQVCLVRCS